MRRHLRTFVFWILGLFCVAAVACFVRYLFLPLYNQVRIGRYYENARVTLNSSSSYREVHIPFREKDGYLCLEGVWSGRPTEAILDTGSAFVSWPASWHIKGTSTNISIKSNMAGGVTIDNEYVVVPAITIGGLQLTDMPTTAFGSAEFGAPSTYSAQAGGKLMSTRTRAILGAPAYRDLVLTIDYSTKEIILRNHLYDVTRQKRLPEDHLIPMSLGYDFLPIISGSIAGIPARLGIDTGCGGMPINGSFVNKLPPKARAYAADTTAGLLDLPVKVKSLRKVTGSVDGLPFTDIDAQTLELPSCVDALVGLQFLKHYRVTIDYTRNLILFEPYPISNSTPHHAT
jgi:hypothetical protein